MAINTFPAASATTYYPIAVSSTATSTYDTASSYLSVNLGTFPAGVYSFQPIRASQTYPASNNAKFVAPTYIQWTTTPATTMFEGADYHDITHTTAAPSKTFYLSSSTNLTLWTYGVYNYVPFAADGSESLYSILDDGTSLHTIGTNYTYHSTDGITWTTSSTPLAGYGTATIVYASNQTEKYLAYAYEYSTSFYTSTDAITWTSRTSPYSTGAVYHIIYDGTQYVSVGYATSYKIHTSTDGITWTQRDSGLNYPRALIYGSGEATPYVAAGVSGSTAYFYYSTDAVTWTYNTSKNNFGSITLKTVLYTGGSYYVYSGSTYSTYGTSTDGVTWTTGSAGVIAFIKEFTSGEYVASGTGSSGIYFSTDPTNPLVNYNYATSTRGLLDFVYHNYSTYKYFAIPYSQSYGPLMIGKSKYGDVSDKLLPFVLERRPAKVIS